MRPRGVAMHVAAVAVLLGTHGCSKLIDDNAVQCRSSSDCRSFAGSACNIPKGVCVAVTGTMDAGNIDALFATGGGWYDADAEASSKPDAPDTEAGQDAELVLDGNEASALDGESGSSLDGDSPACLGPKGCFACTPVENAQFLVACTGSTCVPFDNRSRLTHLNADGTLKPLP